MTLSSVITGVLGAGAGLAALYGVLWLKTRPVRNGTLGQAWGMRDGDEARAEIESIFPGATRPIEVDGHAAASRGDDSSADDPPKHGD